MSGQGDFERRIGRRGFIFNAAAGAVALSGLAGPAARASAGAPGRPGLTSGVQSGDVTARGAVVWARADRRAEMYVEISPTESFRRSRLVRGPLATEATDFTAQVDLDFLPPGEEYHYRVAFAEPGRPQRLGEVAGRALSQRAFPRRAARRALRLGRRHRRPGLGDQCRLRRDAHVRDDAPPRAGLLPALAATRSTPTGRSCPR